MKRLYDRFVDFWNTDRSLSAILISLILCIMVVPSFTAADVLQKMLIDTLLTLSLLAGIRIIYQDRTKLLIFTSFVMLSVLIRVVSYFTYGQFVTILRNLANIISFVILAVVLLFRIFREGPITWERIQGAIAVYL